MVSARFVFGTCTVWGAFAVIGDLLGGVHEARPGTHVELKAALIGAQHLAIA